MFSIDEVGFQVTSETVSRGLAIYFTDNYITFLHYIIIVTDLFNVKMMQ